MTDIDRLFFKVVGEKVIKAADEWREETMRKEKEREHWIKAKFGNRHVYGSRGTIVALGAKGSDGDDVPVAGLKWKDIRVKDDAAEGGERTETVLVPDKRNKAGKEIAAKFEESVIANKDPILKALGLGTTFWMIPHHGDIVGVYIHIAKVAGDWFVVVPKRPFTVGERVGKRMMKDKFAPGVVEQVKEWQWHKAVDEHKQHDDDDAEENA